mmetsp:Transcript_26988/g.86775  ORF Transcript_26988/g.86775 Transcript_26988/m.86775 type:complete len:337 (-) Transcript_26988:82-1092(-)
MVSLRFDAPETELLSNTLNYGHLVFSWLMGAVGLHSTIKLLELMHLSAAHKSQQARSVGGKASQTVNKPIVLIALVSAGLCLGINATWLGHSLAFLAPEFSSGVGTTRESRFWTRILTLVEIGVFSILPFIIVAGARHGLLGKGGVHFRYLLGSASSSTPGARAASGASVHDSSSSFGGNSRFRVKWSFVWSEVAGTYLLRLLFAGILFSIGYTLLFLTYIQGVLTHAFFVINKTMLIVTASYAFVFGLVTIFCAFHVHGTRSRIAAAIVLGGLLLGLNLCAWSTLDVYAPHDSDLHFDPAEGETAIDSRPTIVVVALLSSIIRFGFMGLVSTEVA